MPYDDALTQALIAQYKATPEATSYILLQECRKTFEAAEAALISGSLGGPECLKRIERILFILNEINQ